MEALYNRFRTDIWKADSWQSVDYYNAWFMSCAPNAYKTARKGVMKKVLLAFKELNQLRDITIDNVLKNPSVIAILRACTCPPLAIDRLSGLSYTSRSLISSLENGTLPKRMDEQALVNDIGNVIQTINRLLDIEIFPWLSSNKEPSAQQLNRSAAIVSDRISGSLADPIIRNSQEQRQLNAIDTYLKGKGYTFMPSNLINDFKDMPEGVFTHHLNVPIKLEQRSVNMPIDVVVKTKNSADKLPLLIECKSAGDFANTNKRRKEEAVKVLQLRNTYGQGITFVLFLCGYFDTSYLGYEASEHIDWVWEHRITDFETFGI